MAAWSFGVWVADFFSEKLSRADARAAVCGSPYPVDANMGIPPKIFNATLNAFDETSREKFYSRVCGGARNVGLKIRLSKRSAGELREELETLGKAFFESRLPNPAGRLRSPQRATEFSPLKI